jgi:prephenate dehydratase
MPASSTAEAVRLVAEEDHPGWAALGTALAAEIYGGVVIRRDVQDSAENETRFVWLARRGSERVLPLRESPDVGYRTSLVFWGAGAGYPGWLVRCLQEFSGREINLTRIESRPRRNGMGQYVFFVDLEGRLGESRVDGALVGLRALCEDVRVLGSYR